MHWCILPFASHPSIYRYTSQGNPQERTHTGSLCRSHPRASAKADPTPLLLELESNSRIKLNLHYLFQCIFVQNWSIFFYLRKDGQISFCALQFFCCFDAKRRWDFCQTLLWICTSYFKVHQAAGGLRGPICKLFPLLSRLWTPKCAWKQQKV